MVPGGTMYYFYGKHKRQMDHIDRLVATGSFFVCDIAKYVNVDKFNIYSHSARLHTT